MKILLLILAVFCAVAVNAAKVALIATASELMPVTDQALTAMSNDPGVEFLDRASLETALNERNLTAAGVTGVNLAELGKAVHADLFAIIVAKPGKKENNPIPSGLVIYDARNGFRLANIAIPEKTADCVKAVTGQLHKTLEANKHPEKQFLLSIVTTGMPERFRYQQAFIAAELERRLSAIPDVAIQEHDYLENADRERTADAELFKLAPSALRLRLEFAPGSSPEIAAMTLRVTDAADKELFRYADGNCFAGNAAEKAAAATAGYLKAQLPPDTSSAAAEAARLFEEQKLLYSRKDYRSAQAKLDAAIALNLKIRDYRCWKMALNRDEVPEGNYQRTLEANLKNMELVREFHRDFPKNYNYLYTNNSIFARPGCRRGVTSQELAAMAAWAEKFRPLYDEEWRRVVRKFDLRDGVNSYTEWQNYNIYCAIMCAFEFYYDCGVWSAAVNKLALEHLKAGREYAGKHPEWCAASSFDSRIFRYLPQISGIVRMLRDKTSFDSQAAGEKLLLNCDEYIAAASNHPLLQLRIDALQLKLMRDTVKNRYTPAEFTGAVTEYCKQGIAIDDKIFAVIGVRELVNFFGNNSDYTDIARKVQKKVQTSRPDSMISLFAAVNAISDWDEKIAKVIELSPKLLKYKDQAFVDANARNFFFDLGAKIANDAYLKNNDACRKALAIFNEGVIIESLAAVSDLSEKTDKQSGATIQNVLLDGDNLDLLLLQKKKEKDAALECRAVARLDLKTAGIKMLTPWTPPAEAVADPNPDRRTPFAIEDDLVAIAGNKTVYVMSLRENSFHEIRDLPASTVMGLAILNRRICVFAGEEKSGRANYAFETVLFSCDPGGGDRKTHISASNDDKKETLGFKAPFSIYTLVADRPRNRLFFNMILSQHNNNSNDGSGLWEYNMNSKSPRLWIRTSTWSEIDPQMTAANGVIFCSFSLWDYYIHDMNSDHGELFFSASNGYARHCLEAKYPQARRIYYKPVFFSRTGQIWFGGDNTVKLLTLPDVSQSPLIFMPPAATTTWRHLVFPHPDGKSAISVDENNVYKITPKENAKQ